MSLKYKQFRGCGHCKLNGDCKKYRKKVKITFTKSEYADNWGRRVEAFSVGEAVIGEAVIKENTVYCAVAESKIYKGYDDFIGLNHLIVEE